MYYKIHHLREVKDIPVPVEIQEIIERIAKSLDDNYGADRDLEEDGGYILFADNKADLELLCELETDIESCTAEYAEEIKTPTGTYINALFLFNNEFAVTLIIPLHLAPKNIIEAM